MITLITEIIIAKIFIPKDLKSIENNKLINCYIISHLATILDIILEIYLLGVILFN